MTDMRAQSHPSSDHFSDGVCRVQPDPGVFPEIQQDTKLRQIRGYGPQKSPDFR